MGEYVTRSNDEEMKAFYQEAIYPLADKEIRMNDCFVALEKIRNDQVKAFLFYKLSYGINSDIDMKLLISTENAQVNIPTDWEFVEMLVRILGIWLDNALEECATIKGEGERSPQCLIKIKQNEQIKQLQIQEKIVFLSTSDTKILQYVQSNPEPFLCFLDLDLSCSIRLKNSIKVILNKADSK